MEAHRAQMEDPRAFGNTLRLREEARDAWGWNWLDDFVHDTRFAFRTLRHILRIQTYRDRLATGLDAWIYRAGASIFAAFAAIALLLAVIGVYGVKSYVVSRRTREFGIRIATGAHPRALVGQVLREGGRITAIGIGIGLLLALGAGQLLQGFLYGVSGFEPLVLIAAPVTLLAASLLASYIPALRATRVDPTVALRAE